MRKKKKVRKVHPKPKHHMLETSEVKEPIVVAAVPLSAWQKICNVMGW